MSKYSIKDLEHLSGIKAHTIRIWEKRYQLLSPKRTPTNIRYYQAADLKLILNISRLKEHGFKISKIAEMSQEGINELVMNLSGNESDDVTHYIHRLTTAMIDLDEPLFETTLSTCILQFGFEHTMLKVIYPFLVKIGFLWQTEAIHPAQEHFITCLIRQKIIVAIDGQRPAANNSLKFLLFLPEHELHEINLLFAHYLLSKHGQKVIYLGQNLPFADLLLAYDLHRPKFLLTSVTSRSKPRQLKDYLVKLNTSFPDSEVLIGGASLSEMSFELPSNLVVLQNIQDLQGYCHLKPEPITAD